MSAALFDTLGVVRNDHSIASAMKLPTVAELRRLALAAPYVLRYEGCDDDEGSAGVGDLIQPFPARGPAAEGVALTTTAGTLSPAIVEAMRTVLARQWPTTLEEWPLCEVNCLWLARPAGSIASANVVDGPHSGGALYGYGELLCASRWEVVGTVFALERYQLVRVPFHTEGAWQRWQEATTAPRGTGNHTHSPQTAAAVVVWGDGLPEATPTAHSTVPSAQAQRPSSSVRPSPAGRSPLVSVAQASQSTVDCTICRVLSNVDGEPPVPQVAAQRLLGMTDRAVRECFFGTCVPLLGVAHDVRGARWRKTQQVEQDLNRSFSPCSTMDADNSGLHEGSTPGVRTTSSGSVAHGHISLTTEGSEMNVHWDSLPTTASTAAAQAATPHRHRRHTGDGRAALPPTSGSHRGSGLSSSSYSSAHEASCQHLALGRGNHLLWQLIAMPSLFDLRYFSEAGDGWQRWRDLCGGGINRRMIVNSIDEIVDYCACSRRAFYAAVACLDRFVATAVDPAENCRTYLRAVGAPETTPINMDRIVTFFTQVITVCAMLGCKNMDLYPPHVHKVLLCLKPTMRLSLSDFDALELHILATIRFDVQPVTLDAAVETLLHACGTDAYQEDVANVKHYHALFNTTRSGEQYLKDDFEQRMVKAAASVQARRRRQEELRMAMCGSDVERVAAPAEVETPAGAWEDFCQFARFLSDQLIRGLQHNGGSPGPEGVQGPEAMLEGYLWTLPPVLLSAAVVIVTAEMFDVPLPAPLFWLLPETYKDGLRGKKLAPPATSTPDTLAAATEVHTDDEDTRVLLKSYTRLLFDAANDLAATSRARLVREGFSGNGVHGVIGSAIGVVQHVYQECRNTPCDKPLLKRYQTLFKRLNPVA